MRRASSKRRPRLAYFPIIAGLAMVGILFLVLHSTEPTYDYSLSQHANSANAVQARDASVPSERNIPGRILIQVPFSPQAPLAHWDKAHEESCEEMSLIMVEHFWKGVPLGPEEAEKELQDLIAWETKKGYGPDVTMQQLATIAREYFGLKASIETSVSAQTLKRYLASGFPIIVPAAGRELHNPYFSGLGPWYHNLVVIGYRDTTFITNDPGTKRGERYEYSDHTLLGAIHDWTGVQEEIQSGKKAILILQQ